jgi:hypothetical protein
MQDLFCDYRTLAMRLETATLGLIVERCPRPQGDNRASSGMVVVREMIKSSDERQFPTGTVLQLPVRADNQSRILAMRPVFVDEQLGDFALVFAVRDNDGRLGITEIEGISEPEADFFFELSRRTGLDVRMPFLLQAEASQNKGVSEHAFGELQAISKAELLQSMDDRHRDFVLRRLRSSRLTTPRRIFYLTLLGLVGEPTDVTILETYVFPSESVSDFLEVAAASYLRLGGEQAGRQLVEHHFSKPVPPAGTSDKMVAQTKRLLAVYTAIRDITPELEREAKVGEYLLQYTGLGDIVLINALNDGDSRFIDAAMKLFQRTDAPRYLREKAVVYLSGILDTDIDPNKGEQLDRFLKFVRKSEPDLYQESLQWRRYSFRPPTDHDQQRSE